MSPLGGIVALLALAAIAKGVLGIVGTLAYPPVALTAGALGGGVFGWSFMQQRAEEKTTSPADALAAEAATLVEPIAVTAAASKA